jgi:raffinose/stachyose/melibiose transport system substrate-binding protein
MNEYSRRTILKGAGAVGLSAFTAAALAACSADSGSSTGTAASGSGKVSGPITLWFAPDNPSVKSQDEWKKWNVEAFEKLYPQVQVTTVLQNVNTLSSKQQVALAAGSGPDLITTPGSSNAIPYGRAGYFKNLDAAAKANDWKKRLLPWALDMGYINDTLQALPTSYESMVLYYNKTVFDKHGWKVPTDRSSLESLAGDMQSKGIIPFAAGNASYQPATEWLVSMFFNAYAGPSKVYDALSGKAKWTESPFTESIQLLKDYFQKGYFQGGVKPYFSTQDPQKYAIFASGKAAMYLSGSWEMENLGDYFGKDGNKNEWAWAPMPPLASGVPSDIYPLSVGGTMSVNAHSKNIPAATAYIEWLFSDTKNMWGAAAATGSEPLPITFKPSDVPASVDKRYKAQYQAINDASVAGRVGYVTWTSFGAKADNYIIDNIDKVINGGLGVAPFCAGIQSSFDSDKKAGLIPPLFTTGS